MQSNIGQKFQANINKCDICFGNYDRQAHAPVIICSMHHTVCKSCMDALRAKPQCPFCREPIRMDKITINNYIFYPAPNVRVQSERPHPLPTFNMQSEGPHPAPGQNYYQPVQNNDAYGGEQLVSINQRENAHVQQPNEYDPDMDTWVNLFIFLCIQIPLTVMNLFMGLGKYGNCENSSYDLGVRPWYLAMGIIECATIGVLLLVWLLLKGKCLSKHCFMSWTITLRTVTILKVVVWAIAVIFLFSLKISRSCSSLAYGYGLFLTILNGVLLLVLICAIGFLSYGLSNSSGHNLM